MLHSSREESVNESFIPFDLSIGGTSKGVYFRRASSETCRSALSSMDRDNGRKCMNRH